MPQMFRRLVCAALFLLLGLSTDAAGQTITSGSITGVITDESGGVLPGATVTVTSPALQVPQVVTVSGGTGEYRFLNLPPGAFRLAYELPGFATLVREGIVISAGFDARVNVVMILSTQAETVTVIGESPIVDLTSTRGGATVTREVLEGLPTSYNYQETMLLVPGVQFNGPPMTGEIGYRGHTGSFKTYGLAAQMNQVVEGVYMVSNERPDFVSIEEVDTKTYGNTAEIPFPGAATQIIVKSGGNTFSGRYMANGVNRTFQSSNIDDRLRAQGVTQIDGPLYYWNATGDLGGRVIPDKVWFYGALNETRNRRTAPGYSKDAGPDGIYQTPDDTPGEMPGRNVNRTLKLSYQMTPSHRLVGFYTIGIETEMQQGGERRIPFESTAHIVHSPKQKKIEWQGAFGSRLLANLMFGRGWYDITFRPQETVTAPNSFDRNTGYQTGQNWHGNASLTKIPSRHQLNGSLSYQPVRSFGGAHQLRAGFNMWWGRNQNIGRDLPLGNYQQIFDTVGGVPHTPVEIQTRNFPYDGRSGVDTLGVYVTDMWRPTGRLTLNLGMRAEAQHAFVPAQTKVQGPFGGSGSFPFVDAGSWKTLAPRAGVAFDVSGNGRTVAKGTVGKYYLHTGHFSDFAQNYNFNAIETVHFRWRDPNGDKVYQPGEVDLNLNGPDFLSITGAGNNIINPDLNMASQLEVTGSLERDLGASMSIRGLYVYKRVDDQIVTINTLRPYSAWNRAFTRRDPGPDGILRTRDDGGLVTVYDYDPAFAGGRFVGNMRVNADRSDTFNSYEISLNKRQTGKWFATTSVVATKNHRWLVLVPQSPNDELFPLDETWDVDYRLAAGYELPLGLRASTLVQVYRGFALQRTNLFRAADPEGGPRFPSSSSINLRMEPFDGRRGPLREVTNVRLSRAVRLGGNREMAFDADVTNLFNRNVAWGSPTSGEGTGTIMASGPTFGYVTRIMQPRALRLGVTFSF